MADEILRHTQFNSAIRIRTNTSISVKSTYVLFTMNLWRM